MSLQPLLQALHNRTLQIYAAKTGRRTITIEEIAKNEVDKFMKFMIEMVTTREKFMIEEYNIVLTLLNLKPEERKFWMEKYLEFRIRGANRLSQEEIKEKIAEYKGITLGMLKSNNPIIHQLNEPGKLGHYYFIKQDIKYYVYAVGTPIIIAKIGPSEIEWNSLLIDKVTDLPELKTDVEKCNYMAAIIGCEHLGFSSCVNNVNMIAMGFYDFRLLSENNGRQLYKALDCLKVCRKCNKCGKQEIKLLVCAKCKVTRYCSRKCQTADWPDHKHQCS